MQILVVITPGEEVLCCLVTNKLDLTRMMEGFGLGFGNTGVGMWRYGAMGI